MSEPEEERTENENCLEGIKCPKCGSLGPFKISATVLALVFDNGAYVDANYSEGKPYGWGEPAYHDVLQADSRKCSRMAKTLRVLEGKIRKLSERLGAPHTLGQHVNRFALALGASHMVIHEFAPGDCSYETAKRTVVELGEIATVVDRRAAALVSAA